MGTGLNTEENQQLLHRLERASPRPRNPAAPGLDAPACVTNGSGALTKHVPDVWYDEPEASVVLSIISDIRMMRTNRFATGLSVRFPRVKAIRDAADKAPRAANSLPELMVMVRENRGLMAGGDDKPKQGTKYENGCVEVHQVTVLHRKRKGAVKPPRASTFKVPSHLRPIDVSNVPVVSHDWSDQQFYIARHQPFDQQWAEGQGSTPLPVLKQKWLEQQRTKWGSIIARFGGTVRH